MSATLSTARSTLGQLLQETLHNDLLNFWGSKIHPLWSVDQALAQIVGRQIIAEGSITLTLKVNRNVQITLQRQQRSLSVPVGQSILTALEAAGIAHPTGCHRHGWRAQRCLVLPRLWRIWKSRTTSCTANMTG